MSKKLPKQNVQQAFNQFLFDTMMERIRAAELLGQKIDVLRDRVDVLESQDSHSCHNVAALQEDRRLIEAIEAKMKEQREDYHGHIRQLVTENEAAHKGFFAELSQVAADTNKALIALKKTADVGRECSNAQAVAIGKLQDQLKNISPKIDRRKKKSP